MKYRLIKIIMLIFIAPYIFSNINRNCILVSVGQNHFFWDSLIKGSEDAASKFDIKIISRSAFIDQKPSLMKQIEIIQWGSNYGCDKFIIAPTNFKINGLIKKLQSKGASIIYVDRSDFNNFINGSILTNNFIAGMKAFDAIGNKKGDKIAFFRMSPNTVTTHEREEGFLRRAKEAGVEVEDLGYIGGLYYPGLQKAKKVLQSKQGLNAVFAPNEVTTMSVSDAIKKLKLKKIKVIGFDINPEIFKKIKNGYIYGVILQDPYSMGYLAIENMVKSKFTYKNKNIIYTDTFFVTRNNINENAIREKIRNYGVNIIE